MTAMKKNLPENVKSLGVLFQAVCGEQYMIFEKQILARIKSFINYTTRLDSGNKA